MSESVEKTPYSELRKNELLKKKHSSGDLQSRLKTRKILGVGEINNGDVHRSKISQVLGHNDHLYIKFPRFYSLWHFFLASMYTLCGLSNLFCFHRNCEAVPSLTTTAAVEQKIPQHMEEYERFYGCKTLGFAILMWILWDKADKSLARALMATTAICEFLQVGVICLSLWRGEIQSYETKYHLIFGTTIALISIHFTIAIGSSTAGLRKAPSHVVEQEVIDDGTSPSHECKDTRSEIIPKPGDTEQCSLIKKTE